MDHDLNPSTIVTACPDLLSAELDGEVVLLHPELGLYFGLNSTGTWVWNYLRGPRTVQEISDALAENFDVESGSCLQDLLDLLRGMADEGPSRSSRRRPMPDRISRAERGRARFLPGRARSRPSIEAPRAPESPGSG